MLYDNALLARVYTHLWRVNGSAAARRVAEETCDWMIRELRTPEGGLAASLDADSEGGEGAFYAWRPSELRSVLGDADAEFAAEAFGVTASGTFEHGASVLRLLVPPSERLDRIRGELAVLRDRRPRPPRDDKVVAAWNGLALSALAEAGLLFDRPDFVAAALDIAELLSSVHLPRGDRLVRTSRDGVAGDSAGQLEDYACVASGLIALSGVTADGRWTSLAGRLLDTVLSAFGSDTGGFYDTPDDGEQLIFRPADPADNATPSGTFAAADALLSYSALTGLSRYRDAAVAALGVLPGIASRYPRAAGSGLSVACALLAGPPEIAVVGPLDDPRTVDLQRTALHVAPGGSVLAAGQLPYVPLLEGRPLVLGGPTAYVCRDFVCLAPVVTVADLRAALANPIPTSS
jgi:uncharacterized protein